MLLQAIEICTAFFRHEIDILKFYSGCFYYIVKDNCQKDESKWYMSYMIIR